MLVVLDGARRLRMLPGVPALLRDGPTAGVHALCLEVEQRLLPEECGAVAVCGLDGLRVQPADAAPVVGSPGLRLVRRRRPAAGAAADPARTRG